ncbi:MAG: DUF2235 domain-containing protein [Betaproteobacteria bacterium]|jgi:uncharacterized protein (DUF2235 family)|nr:MAG: DUF2235 domain-containing protein [Betaproteobacteria bacterium]
MPKRIVICADGTWNRPEEDPGKDFPTNVLRLARAIRPAGSGAWSQQVFYDWGVGSYYDRVVGGATGRGLHKNILDDYRYIVQNYAPGDEIFLFGFSRGAYTVRSLCGLINNCGILKRPDARLIQATFDHYKNPGDAYVPRGSRSIAFRKAHSHASREVKFVGVWDTVGAMGIPFSFLGLLNDEDEFYDTKIGSNVRVARHAMAIDERRADFEPTVWYPRDKLDLKQVWFCGAHSDVGGSHSPDSGGWLLSDITLAWMMREASKSGLTLEPHLKRRLRPKATATLHESRRSYYRIRKKVLRPIDHGKDKVLLHQSVKQRWDRDKSYRPKNLADYIRTRGWPSRLVV